MDERETCVGAALDIAMINGQVTGMMDDFTTTAAQETSGCLRGAKAWIISDGKAGMVVQMKGVADALGLDYEVKTVSPSGIYRIAAPWGPVAPSERFGQPGSQFAPPWPTIALATGRASIPYIRKLRKHAGSDCFAIVLQDPKTGRDTADMIWVPAHDKRRGANVITTVTAPHSFSAARLDALRASTVGTIAALPAPRAAVILGGKNGVYKFRDEDDSRLERSLAAFADLGASFMITASRRTHDRLLRAVERATASAPRIVWRNEHDGPNPYPDFLANADFLIVTADSVNMTGEACATGRSVYVFFPSGGSPKFQRFHDSLHEAGATRPLPEAPAALPDWSYEPIISADTIAREIEMRWIKRRAAQHGLTSGPKRTNTGM